MKAIFSILLTGLFIFGVQAQKRTIDVSSFSELSFAVSGNLYLKQGSDEKVEVDCSDELFEELEFELRGDRLTIKKEGSWWKNMRNSNLDIYITMKDIEEISVSGSGSLYGENTFKTDDLELSVSGSGDMELDLESAEVEARISGSGSIRLNGNSERTYAKISGSGKVKAEDMETRIFEASISGSGNCYVTASEEVKASISGSGNVYYSGNPDRVISNSSGSGKIRRN